VQKNAKVGAAGEKMAEFSLRHAHPNFAGASTLKRTLKNETGKTIYTGPNRTGARVTDVALPAEGGAVGTLEVKTLQEPIDPLIFAQGSSQLEKERKIMSQGQVYWGSSDNLCPVVPGEGPGVTTGWWQWYPPKDVQ